MQRIHLFFVGMLFCFAAEAQEFNYSVSTDSVGWQELNSQTILNTSNSAWEAGYEIPIGFTLNYLGQDFDSLRIETNGYLVFDQRRNYAFTSFHGFGDMTDSLGNHSVLGYSLSGSTGNHILKIQFKNVGEGFSANRFLSYQIWLYESGEKIELHVGPNDFGPMVFHNMIITADSNEVNDTTIVTTVEQDSVATMIGLLNMNLDTDTRGYFFTGSVETPVGEAINDQQAVLPSRLLIPHSGYKYTFNPVNN